MKISRIKKWRDVLGPRQEKALAKKEQKEFERILDELGKLMKPGIAKRVGREEMILISEYRTPPSLSGIDVYERLALTFEGVFRIISRLAEKEFLIEGVISGGDLYPLYTTQERLKKVIKEHQLSADQLRAIRLSLS